MVGDYRIDHPVLYEVEVVSVSMFPVTEQVKHALLGKRSEEKGELMVVITVARIE